MKARNIPINFAMVGGLCMVMNVALAHEHKIRPYVGAEYKLSYTINKENWNRLLSNHKLFQSGTIFAGLNFHKYFSGEVGFTRSSDHTQHSSETYSVTTNSWLFAPTITNVTNQQAIKLGFKSVNFDVNGQYPISNHVSVLGTLGVATTKPIVRAINLGNANNSSIETISGKRKSMLRVGVGLQYAIGMCGVRTRILWEDTSKIKINPGNSTVVSSLKLKPFKDTFAWTIGAFIRW